MREVTQKRRERGYYGNVGSSKTLRNHKLTGTRGQVKPMVQLEVGSTVDESVLLAPSCLLELSTF